MQFLFPVFLWGLLGTSIPVLIHLLQLRRQKRIRFTNITFIREVELKSNNRTLQNRLVLLLRVLAVVFLVLMFCQPFIPSKSTSLSREHNVGVVVDTSPTMRVRQSNQESLLDQAILHAAQLGKSYSGQARFRLVGSSNSGEMLGKYYEAALATLPVEAGLINWEKPSVRQNWQAQDGGPLYVFSNFQKSLLPLALVKKVSAKREVVLLPQLAQPTGNLYVDSVWLNDAFVRVRANMSLHIKLRNGGSNPVADCPVKVLMNNRQVSAFRVTVGANQAAETVVQVQVPDGQLVAGRVISEDAPVTFDNTYFFTLQPTQVIRVLEIGSEPQAKAAYQNESLFQYTFTQAQRVDFGSLRQANMVLLSEPKLLDAGLREALVAVVQRGGSVVVVPTANSQVHESYTQLLRALGVGGVEWESVATTRMKQQVAMPDLRSPFFKEVFGAQPRQVTLPEVSPVLRLTSGGTDILRLRDGESFLSEFASGLGRVYVFSAPFAGQYSDFTTHSLFVPVLYRLAMLSYRADQPLAYRIGQSELTLTVPQPSVKTEGGESSYRLVRDSVTLIPAQRQQGQQLRLELPAELTTPGFYKLQQQGREIGTVAFNRPQSESELATYSAAELRQLFGNSRPNVHVLDEGAQPQALLAYRAGQTAQPLWRYCLGVVLACLLIEEILLRRARQRRQPQAIASR